MWRCVRPLQPLSPRHNTAGGHPALPPPCNTHTHTCSVKHCSGSPLGPGKSTSHQFPPGALDRLHGWHVGCTMQSWTVGRLLLAQRPDLYQEAEGEEAVYSKGKQGIHGGCITPAGPGSAPGRSHVLPGPVPTLRGYGGSRECPSHGITSH